MTREIAVANTGVLAELKELGVNRDDIVSIHTAAVEQSLLKKQAELEQEQKELARKSEESTKTYQKALDAFSEKEVKRATAEAQKTVETLAKLGFEKPKMGDMSPSFEDKESIVLRIGFTTPEDRYGGIHQQRRVAYSKAVLDARKVKEQAQAAVLKCQERLLEIKLALANIVREERSAKAALAMAALEQTEAGRAIIEKLRGLCAGSP